VPGGGSGTATTWYSGSGFSFDINLTDGQSHPIALYAVDWDSKGRAETVQVLDGSTNVELGMETLSDFVNGVYLVWTVSGHVKITVTANSGPNAVISGVFFGGNGSGIIHVPGDQPTIQADINAAANGNTVLVAPGTYTENIDFEGKAITVTSSGGPSVTTIDGGANGSVVTFDTGEGPDSILSGFTIQNGLVSFAGGGIQIGNASPTITGNTITGNRAPVGLGIYINGGSPLIQNNLITGNNSQAGDGGEGGGGILISASNTTPGSPQVIGNTITNNSVAAGGNGGGISVNYFGNPTIRGNLIAGNTAWNDGGGLSIQNYNGASVVQNIIVNNTSLEGGSGAGLYVSVTQGTSVTIADNTIAGNSAFDLTSGIYVTGFPALATFVNNIVVALGTQQAVTCGTTYSQTSPVFSYNDAYSGGQQAVVGNLRLYEQHGEHFVRSALRRSHVQQLSPSAWLACDRRRQQRGAPASFHGFRRQQSDLQRHGRPGRLRISGPDDGRAFASEPRLPESIGRDEQLAADGHGYKLRRDGAANQQHRDRRRFFSDQHVPDFHRYCCRQELPNYCGIQSLRCEPSDGATERHEQRLRQPSDGCPERHGLHSGCWPDCDFRRIG